MAGTITPVRSSNFNGTAREVILTLTCLSDAAAGTIPDYVFRGMQEFVLVQLKPTPHATTPITAAFEAIMVDADGSEVFESGEIATTDTDIIGGNAGHPAGHYPRMDSVMTLKFVTHADHTVAANVGNSKIITLQARFEKK